MIARGYIRVSTDEQAKNGDSIPAQKKILDTLAVVKGYDDFEYYVDDGYSGKNLNRPQIQKLRRNADKVASTRYWSGNSTASHVPSAIRS